MPAYICAGEMAERSNAAVLKTVEGNTSGGSNPSLSAFKLCKRLQIDDFQAFCFQFLSLVAMKDILIQCFFGQAIKSTLRLYN